MAQDSIKLPLTPPLPGVTLVTRLNSINEAVTTGFSGEAPPPETYPYMMWNDTLNGKVKQRNATNSGWVELGNLLAPYGSGVEYIDDSEKITLEVNKSYIFATSAEISLPDAEEGDWVSIAKFKNVEPVFVDEILTDKGIIAGLVFDINAELKLIFNGDRWEL